MIAFINKEDHYTENMEYEFDDYFWDTEAPLEKELKLVAKYIQKTIISNLDWINNFRICILELNTDVGVFINGTSTYPQVGIDLRAIDNIAIDPYREIFLTIMHELYHAYQEIMEYEFDCTIAENFALDLYESHKGKLEGVVL